MVTGKGPAPLDQRRGHPSAVEQLGFYVSFSSKVTRDTEKKDLSEMTGATTAATWMLARGAPLR